MEKDLEIEFDRMDFVTQMMFSTDFLKHISDVIFSEYASDFTVAQFYDEWCKVSGAEENFVPINLGIIVGYMYCGILLTKEKWFNMLPDKKLQELDSSYGFTGAKISDSLLKGDMTYKHVVRRIRNALGHGNIQIKIPNDVKNVEELYAKSVFIFEDNNFKKGDCFKATITIENIILVVTKLHSLAYRGVRNKKNILENT